MESVGNGKWIPADPMAPKVAVGEAGRGTKCGSTGCDDSPVDPHRSIRVGESLFGNLVERVVGVRVPEGLRGGGYDASGGEMVDVAADQAVDGEADGFPIR